jgi:ferric-dicitrate binding protein FerR (iron transport regulator)
MGELIEKYISGNLSREEKIRLLQQSENDAQLKIELMRCKNLNAMLCLKQLSNDVSRSQDSYNQFIQDRKRKSISLRIGRIVSYAAMAACLAGITWLLAGVYFSPGKDSREKFNTLYVPAGQRVNFTMEDGTTVWLNAQSKLTYPVEFKGKERNVKIEGEAYFKVAKEKERPFIVSSKDFKIKVLGTTFNVYSYPGERNSRVSLIAGSVMVYNKDIITLKPQEEVTIEGDKMTVGNITDPNYFLWTKGIYSFDNENLENIVKKLELYYDIRINIEDAAMRQWRYTVKFRQRDGINEILHLMQRIHKFKIKKDEEKNCIEITK